MNDGDVTAQGIGAHSSVAAARESPISAVPLVAQPGTKFEQSTGRVSRR
jgi:hypothetical protein